MRWRIRRWLSEADGGAIPITERGGVGVCGACGDKENEVQLGERRLAATGPTAKAAAVSGTIGRRRRWDRSDPTDGACMTCTGTCGSGCRIAGTSSYRGAPVRTGRPGRVANCSQRVLRGGSWLYGPRNLRSANRIRFTTSIPEQLDIGFRVAPDGYPLNLYFFTSCGGPRNSEKKRLIRRPGTGRRTSLLELPAAVQVRKKKRHIPLLNPWQERSEAPRASGIPPWKIRDFPPGEPFC